MNILVTSENFWQGGLEIHIKTYYENLPENVNVVFAFGNYSGEVSLENAKIYTGFHFSWVDTAKDFCEDVNRLVKIIEDEKIDVVHAHPYHALFASLFASQITKVKLVYTYHGISSFNFTKSPNTSAMFYYAFQSGAVGNVFSVNEAGAKVFADMGYSNSVFLPNSIDLKKFPKATYQNNNKWALLSRLNEDKLDEIKTLIANMQLYNMEAIDIYGSGNCEEELKAYVAQMGLEDKVCLKGFTNDVFGTVNGKYNGIIGIGRVVLEGIITGMPVFLIGFNKLSGFVNTDIYNKLKLLNFSNLMLDDTNFNMPSREEIASLEADARNSFGAEELARQYVEALNKCSSLHHDNLCKLYYEIEPLSKLDNDGCLVHKDRRVYDLIQNYIGRFSTSVQIDMLLTNTNASYEVYDRLYKELSVVSDDVQKLNAKSRNIFVRLFRRVKQKCGKNSRN